MTVPTAGSADYRGEAGVTIIPELALSRAFGPLRLAFNGGVRVRTTSVDFLGLSLSHELSYRFGVGLAPTKAFEIDAALSGNTSLTSPFSDLEASLMEVLLALRFRPIKALDVTVGGGFGLREAMARPTLASWPACASTSFKTRTRTATASSTARTAARRRLARARTWAARHWPPRSPGWSSSTATAMG